MDLDDRIIVEEKLKMERRNIMKQKVPAATKVDFLLLSTREEMGCVFAWLCSLFAVTPAWARDGKVTLLFLSHIRSQLLPVTSKANKTTVSFGGLAYAAVLPALKNKKNPDAIFFHRGEAVDGSLWRNFKGKPEFSALNAAGIQLGMFGKHEFDYGFEHMKTGLSYAAFPIVVSNVAIDDPSSEKPSKK